MWRSCPLRLNVHVLLLARFSLQSYIHTVIEAQSAVNPPRRNQLTGVRYSHVSIGAGALPSVTTHPSHGGVSAELLQMYPIATTSHTRTQRASTATRPAPRRQWMGQIIDYCTRYIGCTTESAYSLMPPASRTPPTMHTPTPHTRRHKHTHSASQHGHGASTETAVGGPDH